MNFINDSNRYSTEKGEISLITPCLSTQRSYEIYCIEGELFDDIERYHTLNEAESRIFDLLGPAQQVGDKK